MATVQQITHRLSGIQLRPINNFVDIAEAFSKLLFVFELINTALEILSGAAPPTPGLYVESTTPVVVPAGSNPIPGMEFTPPAGTYLVIFSAWANGSGVSDPGAAIGVGGTIVPSSTRPMSKNTRARVEGVQAVVTVNGSTSINALSTGTTGSKSGFTQRNLAAIRLAL